MAKKKEDKKMTKDQASKKIESIKKDNEQFKLTYDRKIAIE